MTTDHIVARPLTDTELAGVLAGIEAATAPTYALIEALRLTFAALLADTGERWDSYDDERRLDGRRYAIPDTQWCTIGDALTQRARALATDTLTPVNLALDWMNIGPAGYTP